MFTYVDVLAKPCPPYLARIGCNTGAMHASTSLAVSARCPCADARSARINRGFAPPLDDHFFFVVFVDVIVVVVVFPRADEDVPAPLSRLFASARAARAASNVRAVCSAFSGRPRPRAYFLSNLPMTRDDDETDTENTTENTENTENTETEARNESMKE
jgi:hypothetical protein